MKNIWIVNYYAPPPQISNNLRHVEFARRLQEQGYKVSLFCASFYYGRMEQIVPKGKLFVEKDIEGVHFVFVKVREHDNTSIKRGLSMFSFAVNLRRCYKDLDKPDVIMHNIHVPFDYPVSWVAKKTGAKYIVEAWDLWPEGFVRFGVLPANHPIVKVSYHYERKLYEKADEVVFTLEGGLDYLRSRGYLTEQGGKVDHSKVHYINNGINLKKFEVDRREHPTKDEDLLNDKIKKIVYVGSIRLVNDVHKLMEAAKVLREHKEIVFVIIGNGIDRPALEQYCQSNGLSNVHFKQEHVPIVEVADIVSHADVNIMNYQPNFGKWGISSSKMFQYYAAGSPICCNVDSKYCEINSHQLGIARRFETAEQYAEAILELTNLTKEEREQMEHRCKDVALKYDYGYLTKKLVEVIENKK